MGKDVAIRMLTTKSITMAKSCKQLLCPKIGHWLEKSWCLYALEYYAAVKMVHHTDLPKWEDIVSTDIVERKCRTLGLPCPSLEAPSRDIGYSMHHPIRIPGGLGGSSFSLSQQALLSYFHGNLHFPSAPHLPTHCRISPCGSLGIHPLIPSLL